MNRCFIASILVIFLVIHVVTSEKKKIVCIYQNLSHNTTGDGNFQIDNIQPDLCTELVYAYFGINNETAEIMSKDPQFDIQGGNIQKFNNLKHKNTNLRTIAGVGGWNEQPQKYSNLFKDANKRERFIKSTIEWLEQKNFDGFMLYWCYPGVGGDPSIDKDNLSTLLKEMHAEYKKRNLILSVMVHSLVDQSPISYDIPKIEKYVDFIYITGFDLYGYWSPTIGPHSALYRRNSGNVSPNVDDAVSRWINDGASPEKLILGVPFFGRTFMLKNLNEHTPGSEHMGDGLSSQQTNSPGIIGYNEFCVNQLTDKWTHVWDNEQKVPYAYKGNQWIGYEDEQSIKEKAKYVNERQLGGIGASFIENDDFKGVCGIENQLLKTMNSVLRTAESDFDFTINLSIFKKTSKNSKEQYTQLLFHNTENFKLSKDN